MNSPGVVFTNAAGTNYNGLVGTQTDSLIGLFGSSNNMPNNGWGLNMNIYNGRVGIGTNAAKAALHVTDSAVLFSGSGTVSQTGPYPAPPIEGAGRRMMWYPGKAAFRVGYSISEWDKDSIGRFSFAAGWRTIAREVTSTAFGEATKAYEGASTALGSNTLAGGYASLSAGYATEATQYAATALGFVTKATGLYSTAMGYNTLASGTSSTAIGYETKATNNDAFTMGQQTIASGVASFAAGTGTKTKAVNSAVFGRYNDSTDAPNPITPSVNDRVFQIGNGSADNARGNALTILRNGNMGVGVLDPMWQLDIAGRMRIRNPGDGNTSAGLWLNKNLNNGSNAFIGNRDDSTVGFFGNDGANWGLMMNTKNGSVQLSNAVQNRKIVLFEGANNDHQFYGFGINGSTLRYQTSGSDADHVFFSGINSASSKELLRIKGDGNVGMGVSDPLFKLDVGGRIRLRGTAGNSAGIWLNNEANTAVPAFMGMQDDNKVGFYGSGNGWGLTMNTQSGSLNINGSAGSYGQVAASNGENQATSWTKLGNLLQSYYRYPSYSSNVATGNPLIKEFDGGAMAITTSSKSRLIISAMFIAYGSCGICTDPRYGKIKLNINGNSQEVFLVIVPPNGVQYITLSNYFYDIPGGNHNLKWELDLSNTFQPMSSAYISNVTVMVLPID